MAVMYVIHDPADGVVVETALLQPLPSFGFDRWISSAGPDWTPEAIQICAAAIVVVSSSSVASNAVRREAERGRQSGQPMIAFVIDGTDPDKVAQGVGALPRLDVSDVKEELAVRVGAALPELLPVVGAAAGAAPAWPRRTLPARLR